MLSKEPVIDANDEAKALGIQTSIDNPSPDLVVKTADQDKRTERKMSLRASGKVSKQGVQLDADGNPVGNVTVVGKKESSCCVTF